MVSLPASKSRGVLLENQFIITSAQCLRSDSAVEISFVINRHVLVVTEKHKFNTRVVFADPVSDFAVLGAVEPPENAEDFHKYELFCHFSPKVSICWSRNPLYEPFSLFAFNDEKCWVEVSGEVFPDEEHQIVLTFDPLIGKPALGSPVVNRNGKLVSIVTRQARDGQEASVCPRLDLMLPMWILSRL